MADRRVVAVAIHDGFYGAGTGAGYANRGFLRTVIGLLAPGVTLVVLPIYIADDSPEYQAGWHADSQILCAGRTVLPVDNGTAGRTRFGGVAAFECAGASTATLLREHVLPGATDAAIVLFDVPFLGVASRLELADRRRVALVPRSTGILHDPANDDRIAYERAGLSFLASAGGRIASISAYMRGHLSNDYSVPDTALVDLSDGLTADEWDYRPPYEPTLPGAAAGGFVLAYGRAQPYKGWDDLVDALGQMRAHGVQLPHAVLAAVTDQPELTPYQRHLAERVEALGLDATVVTRFDPALRGLLAHPALRAVVVPSRTEPFGRVPLEAYAAGAAPVVVTTAGGLPEQVIDGVTGFTAAPADPVSLAHALRRALDVDDAGRERMRAEGLALARSRFDHRDAVREFLDAFAPWACQPPA